MGRTVVLGLLLLGVGLVSGKPWGMDSYPPQQGGGMAGFGMGGQEGELPNFMGGGGGGGPNFMGGGGLNDIMGAFGQQQQQQQQQQQPHGHMHSNFASEQEGRREEGRGGGNELISK